MMSCKCTTESLKMLNICHILRNYILNKLRINSSFIKKNYQEQFTFQGQITIYQDVRTFLCKK